MRLCRVQYPLCLVTLLSGTMALAQGSVGSPREAAPVQKPGVPVVAMTVRDFKLLAPGVGWVSTGNRLFRTSDNGEHWKEISPPGPALGTYASVYFVDEETGWVLFPNRADDDAGPVNPGAYSDWSFTLSYTMDGGGSWSSVDLPTYRGDRGLSDQGVVAFADKLHGWISLGTAGNTLTAQSVLLVTSDGGRLWQWAKAGADGRIDAMLAHTDESGRLATEMAHFLASAKTLRTRSGT